jgi:hypothetical protein
MNTNQPVRDEAARGCANCGHALIHDRPCDTTRGRWGMTYRCQQDQVMDTDEWIATHQPHGVVSKQLNEHQPPAGTYRIFTMTCECGAGHVVTEESSQRNAA